MNVLIIFISGISLVIYIFNLSLLNRFYMRLIAASVLPILNFILLAPTLKMDLNSYDIFFEDPQILSSISVLIFFETMIFLFLTLWYINNRWGRKGKWDWFNSFSLFPQLPIPFLFFYIQRYLIIIEAHNRYCLLSFAINLFFVLFLLGFSQLLRWLIKDNLFILELKLQGFWIILIFAMLLPLHWDNTIGTQFDKVDSQTEMVLPIFLAFIGLGYFFRRFKRKRRYLWKY